MNFLGKDIGKDKYPFIVAEISCNHEGQKEQAKTLIQAAKDAGADAVKIQIYDPDDMTFGIKLGMFFNKYVSEDFTIQDGPWKGLDLYKLYDKTQTSIGMAKYIQEEAYKINIPMFASVFSTRVLPLIELPAYKIASFEITDAHLIKEVAKTGKPVVISTGLATIIDVEYACNLVNINRLVLLHCVSAYPTKLENANLWKIKEYKGLFTPYVGFSDHTRGIIAGPLACAMGAVMLEKHIALPYTDSEDKAFSLTPQEFERYVIHCRVAATATFKTDVVEESYSRQFRRSIYVIKDTKKGEQFTWDNIKSLRPSYGLSARRLEDLASGAYRASCDIKAGTALKEEHLT